MGLLKYCAIFKIQVDQTKLDGLDLQLCHVVNLYEVLEGLLSEDMIGETNPLYQVPLEKEQKKEI